MKAIKSASAWGFRLFSKPSGMSERPVLFNCLRSLRRITPVLVINLNKPRIGQIRVTAFIGNQIARDHFPAEISESDQSYCLAMAAKMRFVEPRSSLALIMITAP
jgi:hypothetical protein